MPKVRWNNDEEVNGFLELIVSPRVEQDGVEEIVTALAKISDFFGMKLIVGDSGGGIPNKLSVPINTSSGKVNRPRGTR